MAAKKETGYRFMVVGKCGSGKSSTANTIMGEKVFEPSIGLASGTKTCEFGKSSKPQKGVTFRIVDTPGLFDPMKSNKEIHEEIIKAAAYLHPGIHAILYVLKVDRYTPEEQTTFNQLKELFDANVVKYVIIIFTRGDELKQNKVTLEEIVQRADQPFKEVLHECGNRVIAFNNVKRDPKHTKALLEIVDKMWKENGEKPYACSVQNTVNEKLEKRADERTDDRIERDPALKKMFTEMGELVRKAMQEAEDIRKHTVKTESQKEMTETIIKDKKAAKEQEEQEAKEKEKQEKMEKEQKALEKKKEEEDMERERKEEEERKAKEELKRKDQELLELQRQLEKLKIEQEMNQKLEEEKQKQQAEYEMKMEKEKLKFQKEELEKTKQDIAENKEMHWVLDAAGVAWKGLKSWFTS